MSYEIIESDAIRMVKDEVNRQVRLKEEGRYTYTPKDANVPDFAKFAMLAEEVGEVARCVLANARLVQEDASVDNLRKELVQVAAIATAWLESPELQ